MASTAVDAGRTAVAHATRAQEAAVQAEEQTVQAQVQGTAQLAQAVEQAVEGGLEASGEGLYQQSTGQVALASELRVNAGAIKDEIVIQESKNVDLQIQAQFAEVSRGLDNVAAVMGGAADVLGVVGEGAGPSRAAEAVFATADSVEPFCQRCAAILDLVASMVAGAEAFGLFFDYVSSAADQGARISSAYYNDYCDQFVGCW